jgi:hypothetical protein
MRPGCTSASGVGGGQISPNYTAHIIAAAVAGSKAAMALNADLVEDDVEPRSERWQGRPDVEPPATPWMRALVRGHPITALTTASALRPMCRFRSWDQHQFSH